MSTETFLFNLIAPDHIVFKENIDMVILPGTEGDFGVLAGHCHFVSTLRPGLIQIYQKEEIKHQVYVQEGFACVNDKGCTVLAQDCLFLKDIDLTHLETLIHQKKEEIEIARTEHERAALQRDLQLVSLKRHLVKQHHGF